MRGHCTPAAQVERVGPEDREIGVDTPDGRRLSRCLRCDVWIEGFPPSAGAARYDAMPELRSLDLPRRGKPLNDAILLRLIALNRGVHSVVFGLLAIALLVLDTRLFDVQSYAQDAADRLDGVAGNTGPSASHDILSSSLHRVLDLNRSTITVLAVTALAYCVIEGVEAVGLWRERRWAEYLTVIATVGFLPFEIHELLDRITVVRVGALILNVAVLVYLVHSKRLFGLRGGHAALHEQIDWADVLAPPPPPEPAPPHATPLR
jgi:uncharacterized membrane protein (DUF2068 family)